MWYRGLRKGILLSVSGLRVGTIGDYAYRKDAESWYFEICKIQESIASVGGEKATLAHHKRGTHETSIYTENKS